MMALQIRSSLRRAMDLFAFLNPVNHTRTTEEVARYRAEPYVVAADVYAADQHLGRGGWTWYTGSAGWMYRVAVEGLLGLRLNGSQLVIDPRPRRTGEASRFAVSALRRHTSSMSTIPRVQAVASVGSHWMVPICRTLRCHSWMTRASTT